MFLTKIRKALKEYHRHFKAWKPLHWCWWFERHGLPVPPYLVGGAAYLVQNHFAIGDNDNADPDLCTFGSEDAPRTGQEKEQDFMIRAEVAETAGNAGNNLNWSIWASLDNNVANAWQIITSGSEIFVSSGGSPADQDPCNSSVLSACGTFQDGIYTDNADESGKQSLAGNYYTEHQWCVQFTAAAQASTDYYFFLKADGSDLDDYYKVPQVQTAEAGAVTHEATATFASAFTEAYQAVATFAANLGQTVAGKLTSQAIFKETANKAATFAAALKETALKGATACAALKETVSDTAIFQAFLNSVVAATAAFQTALKEVSPSTAVLRAALKETQNVAAVAQAYLQDIGAVTGAATFTAALKETASRAITFAATLKETVSDTSTSQAVLKETASRAATISAALKEAASQSPTWNAALKMVSTVTVAAQAIFKETASIRATAQAYLQDIGAVAEIATFRSVLKETVESDATAQALIEMVTGVAVTVQAYIRNRIITELTWRAVLKESAAATAGWQAYLIGQPPAADANLRPRIFAGEAQPRAFSGVMTETR